MSEKSEKPVSGSSFSDATTTPVAKIEEKNLERMEALLKQSAMGIHILFDNVSIAEVMSKPLNDSDFFNFDKMKLVQDSMTELIAKKTYFEKISYLRELSQDNYSMLVRTYFHIVDNNVKGNLQ